MTTSVPPNCCPGGCLAFYTESSPIYDLPVTPFSQDIITHISHLLEYLSKHQLQAYVLRSLERPLFCESGKQWLGKCTSVVVKFFMYHKFDSASFPNLESCTVNSRRVFTEKECPRGCAVFVCWHIDNYFLAFILQVLFKASGTPECHYFLSITILLPFIYHPLSSFKKIENISWAYRKKRFCFQYDKNNFWLPMHILTSLYISFFFSYLSVIVWKIAHSTSHLYLGFKDLCTFH